MSENSKIEWTDHTFNPFIGCTKVSPGCDHCYAEHLMDTRMHKVVWGPQGERVRTSSANWRTPLTWNAKHGEFLAKHGRRQRVFCASLADVFDNAVPDAWRIDLFKLIADTPNLDWLVLTKRIGNVRSYIQRDGLAFELISAGRVWLGATVVNQVEADRDIPKLLNTPAGMKFLSMEPLLGPVDISDFLAPGDPHCDTGFVQGERYEEGYCKTCAGHITDPIHNPAMHDFIDWVIVGGESGHAARPMVLEWAQDIVQQCHAASVPAFVKQLGARPTNREGMPHGISDKKGAVLGDWPELLRVRELPKAA